MKNPVIFTTNTHRSAKGIFDNGEYTMRVEVNKVKNRNSFTYYVNGDCSHGVTRISADESWVDLADWLGAELIVVDKKTLTKIYEDYKLWIKELESERKDKREAKKVEDAKNSVGIFSGKVIDFDD